MLNQDKMEIKLKTLTPVHIGTGNTYGEAEFITEDSKLRRIIFSRLYDSLSEEQKKKLLSELEEKEFNLDEFVRKNKIRISEDMILYSALMKSPPRREIREQIKTNNIPYLPGTSIKGAIRTALLWKYFMDDQSHFSDLIKSLKNELRGKVNKKKFVNRTVNKVFNLREDRFDAKYDILKFLQISDFISEEFNLEIVNVKTYSLKFGKFEEKHFDNFVEVLSVETTLKGTISLNPQINYALKNRREYPLLKNKLRIFSLREDSMEDPKSVEDTMMMHIRKTLEEFNEWALEKERGLCDKATDNRRFIKILGDIDPTDSIRLGFGVGTTYQTLIKMIEEKDIELAKEIVNHPRLRLGRFSRKVDRRTGRELFPPYPKSIEFTQEGEPLGWLRFEEDD